MRKKAILTLLLFPIISIAQQSATQNYIESYKLPQEQADEVNDPTGTAFNKRETEKTEQDNSDDANSAYTKNTDNDSLINPAEINEILEQYKNTQPKTDNGNRLNNKNYQNSDLKTVTTTSQSDNQSVEIKGIPQVVVKNECETEYISPSINFISNNPELQVKLKTSTIPYGSNDFVANIKGQNDSEINFKEFSFILVNQNNHIIPVKGVFYNKTSKRFEMPTFRPAKPTCFINQQFQLKFYGADKAGQVYNFSTPIYIVVL